MKNDYIFIEENHCYQFDFNKALWATDQLHEIFHQNGVSILHDVDFIAETSNEIIFLEYKNASILKARQHANTTKKFNPMADNKVNNLVKKFYDSWIYIKALDKTKPVKYVYILEFPNGDPVTRRAVRNRIVKQLPFALQNLPEIKTNLIDSFQVLDIKDWNKDSYYGQFPIREIISKEGNEE